MATTPETEAPPEKDVRRVAAREIRWLAASLKGMVSLADELDDIADLAKEKATLQAEVDNLKSERSNYTTLVAEIAAGRKELAGIQAQIDSIKTKFRG